MLPGVRNATGHLLWGCFSLITEIGGRDPKGLLFKKGHILPVTVQVQWRCYGERAYFVNRFTGLFAGHIALIILFCRE